MILGTLIFGALTSKILILEAFVLEA